MRLEGALPTPTSLLRPRRSRRADRGDLRRHHLIVALLVGDLDLVARLQAVQLRDRVTVRDQRELLALRVPDRDAVGLLVDRHHVAGHTMRHRQGARLLRGRGRSRGWILGDRGTAHEQRRQSGGKQNGCTFHGHTSFFQIAPHPGIGAPSIPEAHPRAPIDAKVRKTNRTLRLMCTPCVGRAKFFRDPRAEFLDNFYTSVVTLGPPLPSAFGPTPRPEAPAHTSPVRALPPSNMERKIAWDTAVPNRG